MKYVEIETASKQKNDWLVFASFIHGTQRMATLGAIVATKRL